MFTISKSHNQAQSHGKLSVLIDLLVYMTVIGILVIGLIMIAVISLPSKTNAAAKLSQADQGLFPADDQSPARDKSIPEARELLGIGNLAGGDPGGEADGGGNYEPPVAGQGGTCIEGHIIDIYEQIYGGPAWTVNVKRVNPPSDTPIQATPDANTGWFRFEGLDAGTYEVSLTFSERWRPFTPTTFQVTLNGTSPNCANVRFKMEALANLEVYKLDQNGNIGLPNWAVTISMGEVSIIKNTDGQGRAYFPNLAPGVWRVSYAAQPGWQWVQSWVKGVLVLTNPVDITLVSPFVPGTVENVIFVNRQVDGGFIQVVKEDIWGNLWANWTITLTRNDGTHPGDSGITNNTTGVYFGAPVPSATPLPLGDWTVCEDIDSQRPWWRAVSATCQQVNLNIPTEGKLVTFVNEPLGCVDGFKINHLEQGLSNWEIKAFNETTNEEFITYTNANGYFDFYLSLGTWKISEVLQPGWTAVTSSEFYVEVNELFTCEHVRFKNRTDYACVDVYKQDLYDGSGLPGWTIILQPTYGDATLQQSGTTDGTGWVRFNQLPPGDYTIWEVMQPGWVVVAPDAGVIKMSLQPTGACATVTFINVQTNQYVSVDPPSYPPAPPSGTCSQYYTVKSGDTLYGIGVRYGTTWQILQEVNHLTNPRLIYAGMILCIP